MSISRSPAKRSVSATNHATSFAALPDKSRSLTIPCSADEVSALLAGRKTLFVQPVEWKTRQECDGINLLFSGMEAGFYFTDLERSGWVLRSRGAGGCWNDRTYPVHCPLGRAGDVLNIQESIYVMPDLYESSRDPQPFHYHGDVKDAKQVEDYIALPASEMPPWACRLKCRVIHSTVSRLLWLSWDTIRRTGFRCPMHDGASNGCRGECRMMREAYLAAWDDRWSGAGGKSAESPWVWWVEVERVEQSQPARS